MEKKSELLKIVELFQRKETNGFVQTTKLFDLIKEVSYKVIDLELIKLIFRK